MTKKSLNVMTTAPDVGLGMPTIMNPGLAARHGVAYVRLAAFAIDIDRIREHLEEYAASEAQDLPLGWEVFITETYLLENFDPAADKARLVVEDICLDVLEQARQEPTCLGAQLPFAVYDAVARGFWPEDMKKSLSGWKKLSKPLQKSLDAMFADAEATRVRLAATCVETKLDPPLPTPTLDALYQLIETQR